MAVLVMARSWVEFRARSSVVVSSLMSLELSRAIWAVVKAPNCVLLRAAICVLLRALSAVPVRLFSCVEVSEASALVSMPMMVVAVMAIMLVVLNPCIWVAFIT